MKNINKYKERFFTLMESEIGNVKPIIVESSTQVDYNNRKISLDPNTDTMIIPNKKGIQKKVKFTAMGMNIKLRTIEKLSDGFKVCGEKNCKTISFNDVNKIISDVDNGKSVGVIESGKMLIPNLNFTIS